VTPTSQKRDVELPLADVNLASSFPIHSTTEVEWMVHPESWKTPCNPALAELGRGTQTHPVRLEEDGGEPGAGGIVVQACGHQHERFDDTEAVGETPAEEFGVARGDEDAGSAVGID
jgi:hypothetical protein